MPANDVDQNAMSHMASSSHMDAIECLCMHSSVIFSDAQIIPTCCRTAYYSQNAMYHIHSSSIVANHLTRHVNIQVIETTHWSMQQLLEQMWYMENCSRCC